MERLGKEWLKMKLESQSVVLRTNIIVFMFKVHAGCMVNNVFEETNAYRRNIFF